MTRHAGFTLIELLITIAVVAILAAVALPMFGEQMAKSRRAEAISTLAELQLRQERWRASHATYGTLDEVISGQSPGTAGAGAAFNAAKEHYDFSVSGNTATDVVLTATPKGAQTGDRCGNFILGIDNDDPDSIIDKTTSTSAERCW